MSYNAITRCFPTGVIVPCGQLVLTISVRRYLKLVNLSLTLFTTESVEIL